MATGALMNEANLAHARAMNKAAYDALASAQVAAARAAATASAAAADAGTPGGGARPATGPLVPDDPGLNPAAPAELLPLELPASAGRSRAASGAPALVAVAPGYNRSAFADRFGELSFRTLLTQPEVIATLVMIG